MPTLLGIEIGGTKLQLGLGTEFGQIHRLVTLAAKPEQGASSIRDQILRAFHELDVRPDAIGIGFGGPIDTKRGIVVKSNQVRGWEDFPLIDWARENLGVEVVALQNDSDTAALGEARFGAGVGVSPVLYVNSGSGIGGGLVVDGQVYQGSGLGAIEIGHLWISTTDLATGEPQSCTLESIASGWGIGAAGQALARAQAASCLDEQTATNLLTLAEGIPDDVGAELVVKSAQLGNQASRKILSRATQAMSQALAHAVTLLAPKRIILGGGVSLSPNSLWLDPIRDGVAQNVFPPFRRTYDIQAAYLGQDVVIYGALGIAMDAFERDSSQLA